MKLEKRIAQLGVDYAGKDTARDITIEIHIVGSLPMLKLDQRFGDGPATANETDPASIVYNTAIASKETDKAADNKLLNVLVDPNDGDRFVIVGQATSYATKMTVNIYYDAKYRDILVVPELLAFGTDDTVDIFKGATLRVDAYSVGVVTALNKPINLIETFDGENIVGLPDPTVTGKTKTHLLQLSLADENSQFNNIGLTLDAEHYLETPLSVPMQAISLGNLFGDAAVPSCLVAPKSPRSTYIFYAGPIKLEDVLIPLMF